jgi:hypothetical protein
MSPASRASRHRSSALGTTGLGWDGGLALQSLGVQQQGLLLEQHPGLQLPDIDAMGCLRSHVIADGR